jgi:hypothetical protein
VLRPGGHEVVEPAARVQRNRRVSTAAVSGDRVMPRMTWHARALRIGSALVDVLGHAEVARALERVHIAAPLVRLLRHSVHSFVRSFGEAWQQQPSVSARARAISRAPPHARQARTRRAPRRGRGWVAACCCCAAPQAAWRQRTGRRARWSAPSLGCPRSAGCGRWRCTCPRPCRTGSWPQRAPTGRRSERTEKASVRVTRDASVRLWRGGTFGGGPGRDAARARTPRRAQSAAQSGLSVRAARRAAPAPQRRAAARGGGRERWQGCGAQWAARRTALRRRAPARLRAASRRADNGCREARAGSGGAARRCSCC